MRFKCLFVSALLLAGGVALAADAAGQLPMLRFSFLERIRQESSDNVGALSEAAGDSLSYLRVKTSLGLSFTPWQSLTLNLKLTNENRYYIVPKIDPRIKENYDVHEVVFDQLNLRWTHGGSLPLTVTAGRQDIVFGEGFLFADGTPLDGSRTNGFNAARVDAGVAKNGTLTAFYAFQPREDSLLPVINDFHQKLIEQAEETYGLYFSGKVKGRGVEGYLIQKNIRALGLAPDSGITTVGARLVAPIVKPLTATGEYAVQFGHRGTLDRLAGGGYLHLDWQSGARLPWPATVTAGAIWLSGDKLSTSGKWEGWDPLFSRYPKWSESFIYHLAREAKVAYWSNFSSLYGSLVFQLLEQVKLTTTLQFLGAAQRTAKADTLSGAGLNRGVLFQARLQLDASKNMSGHFIWESFRPGNFYFPGANSYTWLRFEWLFKF